MSGNAISGIVERADEQAFEKGKSGQARAKNPERSVHGIF
jgi:hypothetical protein